jgi:protocatechuate 3,4-dioxygenase beta subunit
LLVLQHKLAAVAAAAAIVVFGVWFGMDAPQEAAGAAGGAHGVAVATAPARGGDAAAAADGAQRTAVATDAEHAAGTAAPAGAAAAPAATGTLVVKIASMRGLPLADVGVCVRAMRTASLLNGAEFVRTDRDGTVTFAGLAPGSWMIDIDRANPEGADVQAGETAEKSVRLPEGIAVDGEVVDTDDRPVAGARVLLVGSRTAAPTVALTAADGRFRAEHLAAGLELQAAAAGHAPSLAERIAGVDGERRSVRLRLLAGGGRVVGRVLDVNGAPLAGASVAVLAAGASIPPARDSGHRAQWLRCDRDGRFSCDEVGPGGCTVAAWAADGGSPPSWQRVGASRGEQYVELRLQRGAEVHGRVTKDGEPMADAMLVAWFGDGAADVGYLANLLCFRQTSSDANGDYRLTGLLPGAVLLRAMGQRASAAEQRALLADGEKLEWNVEVGTAQGLRITVHPATAGGEFALWAFLRAPDAKDGDAPGMVLLHDGGSEVWPGKRTGPVDVVIARVLGTDLVQIAARRGVAAREREVVFDLQPAELPTRTIRGRLVDAQLAPVANAAIAADRLDGNGLVVHCEATTGADGAFALGPLTGGRYQLTQDPKGRPRALATATVVDRDEDLGAVKAAK